LKLLGYEKTIIRKNMKVLKYIFISLILLLFSTQVYSAEIKGVVTDSRTDEPMPGTNVFILGARMGAAADNNGFYIIKDLHPESGCRMGRAESQL